MSLRRAISKARSLFSSRSSSRGWTGAAGQESPSLSVRSFSFTSSARTQEMETVATGKKLAQLRELMKQHQVDIYVVPSEDSHQSEYIAPCDARREFISGFTGSAGTAVITLEKAALATDGRYFNQASKQLDDNWELLKQGMADVPTWSEWTAEQAESGKVVGVDPTVITAADARKLSDKIKKKGGKELKAVKDNLVDLVWGSDRPARPNEKVEFLPIEYSGKEVKEKLADMRKELEKKNCAGFIVSMLDEIAWLYNLRGSDIPYNPVFFSYAAIDQNSATLYVDQSKLSPAALKSLEGVVTIKPYEAVFGDAEVMKEALSKAAAQPTNGSATNGNSAPNGTAPRKVPTKNFISNKASWALFQSLGGEEKVEEARSPIADQKACKNETELAGMRACHVRDGAALIEFFAWLEDQLISQKAKLDEVDVADKLEEYRSKKQHFVGLSFPTISSTGANAAIIHYKPERGSCSVVDPTQVYLCDSGAQYYDGTTDTTRTVHFGEPTTMEKVAYTLVLKGNIALERAKFPKGTSGFALDTLARQFLWNEGLDYRHGTGHGVGSYLNVHEGPIGIGTRIQYSEVPLSVGNVISDEPGYYEDNKFGIRIENVIMVKEVATNNHFGDKPYLGFEHVTMVPHCRKLLDMSLLTKDEVDFINEYHEEVLKKTADLFEKDGLERTKAWVERECAPL